MKSPLTLAQHLTHAADQWPAAVALRCAEQCWTFADLDQEARRIAGNLTGETSAILDLAAPASELALAAYGVSAAGHAFWPRDPAASDIQRAAWQALAGHSTHSLDRLPAVGTPLPMAIAASPEAPALVVATSGSEGQPKAVMLSHGNLDAASAAANACLPLAPGDLWLACLPLFHIGGLSILWRCARAGAGVLLHDGFSVAAVATDFGRHPVTHLSLVPAMLARLVDARIAPPPSLRVALVGGAALSRPLLERATAEGWPVYPTWGMSETAAQAATFLPGDRPWQEGLVGHPLPGLAAGLTADGRLRLAGPQVMLGYLNPELRPGLGLDDGWLTTGDLGRIDADGNILILGRADDMLVTGGSNVHPAEVEQGLAPCPGLREVAVTGIPDPVWGDLVVALLVGEVDDATVEGWCHAHLRPAARPRRLVRVTALPRQAGGKIDRRQLRRLAQEAGA